MEENQQESLSNQGNGIMGASDVELSEDELASAIRTAKLEKLERLRDEHRVEQARKFEQELRRPWNPSELWDYVSTRFLDNFGKPFVIDEFTTPLVKLLSHYFTGHSDFEKMGKGYSLDKGLLLMGGIGRGKSTLMRAFCLNKFQPYLITSCRTVAAMFAKDGHEALDKFAIPYFTPFNDQRFFYHKQIGYCFDDLGTEMVKKNFGNTLNVMSEIIQNRYDRIGQYPFNQTHMTTNLTANEIEAMYGSRERSRMREMFNIVTVKGNDRRQ